MPLWPLPGGIPITFPDGSTVPAGHRHDTIFTARQSIFGFQFSPAKTSDDSWTPTGVLEFDLFGSCPADALQPQGRVLNQPRLRVGYLKLLKGMWAVIAGQDKIIISPLDPVSLSHVAVPLGATAGDLWGWLPQVRVELSNTFGDTSTLLQVGVLRPEFSDPRLSDLGRRARRWILRSPDSARARHSRSTRAVSPFRIQRRARRPPSSLGGRFGKEKVGANRDIDSRAGTIDAELPLQSHSILRGEGFIGSTLVPFQGGVLQGVAATPATPPFKTIRPIDSHGGWGELTVLATEDAKNIFYIGAGTDNPRKGQLLPVTTRAQNTLSWINYFRKLTPDVILALEWSNWQLHTGGFVGGVAGPKGPSGRGNVFNTSVAYSF